MVVNLSIRRDGEVTIRGAHGLVSAFGEVQHRQAAMSDTEGAIEQRAVPIGASVGDQLGHLGQNTFEGGARICSEMEIANKATHGRFPWKWIALIVRSALKDRACGRCETGSQGSVTRSGRVLRVVFPRAGSGRLAGANHEIRTAGGGIKALSVQPL
jgi:hypothetical protein